MLSESYSPMDCTTFRALPDDTNAVEAHHRFAKGHCIEPLSVAMMSVYKQDMAVGLQYLAKQHGLSITYEDRTPASRLKRSQKASAARRKRMREQSLDDGPPDKHYHWTPKRRKKSAKKVSCSFNSFLKNSFNSLSCI